MKSAICIIFLLSVYRSAESVNPRYYPKYHLAPPHGWMNDPNGFCYFQDYYHLFYQYNPESSLEPGIAHWGHARSKDLFNWEHLPIAMYPDKPYDVGGVFSGSAIVENGTMFLFYTGNINKPGQTPDHQQTQALAWSTDGVTVTKYDKNPIIEGKNRQPNFRDPKVWKYGDTYYMVLGNSYNQDQLGRVLLYSSKDMITWEEISILDASYGFLGYMWECPDFFELDGYFVLLFSPQGMRRQGIKFNNLYQTGYLVGSFDYETNRFTQETEFRELDSGHDFYATQTIEDIDGQRLLVAWLDMWEEDYPERKDGFTGQMTIPRILTLDSSLRLRQKPVRHIADAIGRQLHTGKTLSGTVIKLENNTGKIDVRSQRYKDFSLVIEASTNSRVIISYDFLKGLVTLDRGGEDGKRSTKWRARGDLRWTVYVDSSSIEVFCGDGEATMSSRFYPDGPLSLRLGQNSQAENLSVFTMKQTVAGSDETN